MTLGFSRNQGWAGTGGLSRLKEMSLFIIVDELRYE